MYCKHCGKEIENNSSFCNHCGKSLDSSKTTINKPVWMIYLIWAFANLYLMMGEKDDYASETFFPSIYNIDRDIAWNKFYYDFSEFIVYVFIIPAILYVVYRRYNKQIDKIIDKLLNKK